LRGLTEAEAIQSQNARDPFPSSHRSRVPAFRKSMSITGRTKAVGLIAAGSILVLIGAVFWTSPRWFFDLVARLHPGCLYQVRSAEPLVALTIDDGPDPLTTPRILDQLRRYDARATFFVITDRIPGQEQLVERVVEEGHELGNHFTRDRPSIRMDRQTFEADLLQAHQALDQWAKPRWARPGSGWYTQEMVEVMRRHGYRCALGSVYPFDVLIPSVSWASSYVLRNVRPGAIIVLHDGGKRGLRTARTLARVLPELRRRGYRIVSLTESAGTPLRTSPKRHRGASSSPLCPLFRQSAFPTKPLVHRSH
jgi:peptidoglycan-N-acetylglucosamine deacetylase